MRDNLTSLVTYIQQNDNTTTLGDFHLRLNDTVQRMNILLNFVSLRNKNLKKLLKNSFLISVFIIYLVGICIESFQQ